MNYKQALISKQEITHKKVIIEYYTFTGECGPMNWDGTFDFGNLCTVYKFKVYNENKSEILCGPLQKTKNITAEYNLNYVKFFLKEYKIIPDIIEFEEIEWLNFTQVEKMIKSASKTRASKTSASKTRASKCK